MPLPIASNLVCTCHQHSAIDKYGDHLSVCKRGQEVNQLHSSVIRDIVALCRHSGLQVRLEPTSLHGALDSDKKIRPDIEIIGLHPTPIFGDVGICYSIPSLLSPSQARIRGRLAEEYAKRKIRKYSPHAHQLNSTFIPFIFESKGYWHPAFKTFFDEVIIRNHQISKAPIDVLKTYWTRRISATLQRTSARGIISKTKRLNAPGFSDEANFSLAILNQADNTR
jgi:hypothetical protein